MAAFTFHIDTSKFKREMDDEFEKVVKKADAVIHSEIKKAEHMAVGLVPVDEGFLKGSIEAVKVSALDYAFVAAAFYAPFIEFGTGKKVQVPTGYGDLAMESGKAGKGSAGAGAQSFSQAIEAWIIRKGIKPKVKATGKGSRAANAAALKQMVFLIKMSILKNGIKPHPFFVPAFERFKSEVTTKLQKV